MAGILEAFGGIVGRRGGLHLAEIDHAGPLASAAVQRSSALAAKIEASVQQPNRHQLKLGHDNIDAAPDVRHSSGIGCPDPTMYPGPPSDMPIVSIAHWPTEAQAAGLEARHLPLVVDVVTRAVQHLVAQDNLRDENLSQPSPDALPEVIELQHQ